MKFFISILFMGSLVLTSGTVYGQCKDVFVTIEVCSTSTDEVLHVATVRDQDVRFFAAAVYELLGNAAYVIQRERQDNQPQQKQKPLRPRYRVPSVKKI
jgi:GDP-D-mannose dehydratase